MKWKIQTLAGLLFVCTLALTACGSGRSTKDPQAVYTQAAQTVAAQLTAAGPQATFPPTRSAGSALTPLATAAPATQAPTLAISLPTVKPTIVLPSSGTTADKAQYIMQAPNDGVRLPVGSPFNMVWTVKNTGTTTWTTRYMLRFYAGNTLSGPAAVNLPREVKPDEQIEISVPLTVPANPGVYSSLWVISNADGANFQPLSIDVEAIIAPTATPTLTLTVAPADPVGTATAATATACAESPASCP